VSAPSDTFKFTLATQGKGQEMMLEIGTPELHGNVVEISGRTEPGAALIINGEVGGGHTDPDGTFQIFYVVARAWQPDHCHHRPESPGRHGDQARRDCDSVARPFGI
jgi:hypothetical protein